MAKIQTAANGCWIWTAEIDDEGYGYFWADQRRHRAHRWAYAHFVGPIPEELVLDHYECDTPSCVNPAHVKPATQAANVQRYKAKITHCPAGHEYTPENTYVHGSRRHCRECVRAAKRRWRERHRNQE